MKESQNPSSQRSQKMITDALLSLMKKYPYPEITVKQIILEAELARKTFYRNFTSKDDVLNSYIDSVILEYTQALTTKPEDPLSVIFGFCEKKRRLLKLLDKNDMLHILLLRLNESLPRISRTTDMSGNPFIRMFGDLEPDYLIAFNVGAIWNVIFKWVRRGMKEPLDEVREIVRSYIASVRRQR